MAAMLKWSFALIALTVVHFLCFNISSAAREANNEKELGNDGLKGWSKKWCIAKPSTPQSQLVANVDYVCSVGGQQHHQIDCFVIKQGGACYDPSNKVSAASVVMNLWFQADGQSQNSCYFNGSGLLIDVDPSIGDCKYPSE